MYYNTISQRYKRAFDIIKTLPWTLLGLTVLAVALMAYSMRAVSMWVLPILYIPVSALLSAGLCGVYLKAERGEKYGLMDLFAAVKDWNTALRVVGGMCWMLLWIYLWSAIPALAVSLILMIPTVILSAVFETEAFFVLFAMFFIIIMIAAMVMMYIKILEYSFTPYILVTRPEIKATAAIKESSRLTKGLKGRIFGAIILPSLIFGFAFSILGGLANLPYIGWLFVPVWFVLYIVFILGYSVFISLVMAGFYNDALNPPPYQPYQQYPPQQGQQYQNPRNFAQYQQPVQPAPQPEPVPEPEQATAEPSGPEESPTEPEKQSEEPPVPADDAQL